MEPQNGTESGALNLHLVDTHCHLDDPVFDADRDQVLEDSRAAGVLEQLLIGYAPEHWSAVSSMAQSTPGMAHTLGVHPSHAQHWSDDIAQQLIDTVESTNAVAIGEFGLDFYRDNAAEDVQRSAAGAQLAICCDLNRPAIFHIRDAESQMLDLLERAPRLPRMVFHSFDGTDRLREFILAHDAWVGVGGLVTRQKSDALREQIAHIPLEKIILETDSPYLVPAKQKDRRNTPRHVRTVAEYLASFLDQPLETIAATTTANAHQLFGEFA